MSYTILDLKDEIVLENGKAIVTFDKVEAYRKARELAISTGRSTKLGSAYELLHGTYVPVDWCPNCTPDWNCIFRAAHERDLMEGRA